jgi:hypothetical protein
MEVCAMKAPLNQLSSLVEYPDADGKPMAESEQAREYLVYTSKVLEIYFQNYPDVYISASVARRCFRVRKLGLLSSIRRCLH